ncbi:MAG: hypothetical protein A4E53_01797 [Pelotomaculum sp. PtaB.Bin104]|nr:MAG: hypothetical protein A4E53_01797 [Pelotomaculum sp. PtaB.Bin104]
MSFSSKLKFILFWCVVILSMLLVTPVALAQGGENADSSGIPGQKPLSFVSISLMDSGKNVSNAVNIPAGEPKFKLIFDKNVVNSTIWGINRKCFSLFDQGNESVPLTVTKIDDTIDFSNRHHIFVQPAAPLKPGTSYTLKISPDLKAKNGVSTLGGTSAGQEITITFKTEGAAQATGQDPAPVTHDESQAPADSSREGGNADQASVVATVQPGASDSAGSIGGSTESAGNTEEQQSTDAAGQQAVGSSDTDQAAASAEKKEESAASASPQSGFFWTNYLTIIAGILIVGWIGVELFIKKRKK